MKKYIHPITAVLVILLILSCEERTSWDFQTAEKFAVADCILTNELRQQDLRLYRSSDNLNESPVGISGAVVVVSDGTNDLIFNEDGAEPGRYVSALPFRATAGIKYRLVLSLGDKADTAYAEMTGISPMANIDIVPKDSLYRLAYHDSPDASMMEVYYDWSAQPAYCEKYTACQASEVYYTLDNIDAGKVFAPDRQIILFPEKTRIIRRKYSLSPAYQQFVRALLLETEWRGGLFDAEPGNVPTNFSHGVHGWFAACMVVSDTTDFK